MLVSLQSACQLHPGLIESTEWSDSFLNLPFFFFKFLLIFKQIGSSWIFEVLWSASKINKAKQFQTIFLTFHPFLLPLVWLWILHVVLVLVPFSVDPLVPNFNFAQTFCLVYWQRLALVKLATCISLMCHFFVLFSFHYLCMLIVTICKA